MTKGQQNKSRQTKENNKRKEKKRKEKKEKTEKRKKEKRKERKSKGQTPTRVVRKTKTQPKPTQLPQPQIQSNPRRYITSELGPHHLRVEGP